eukprot:3504549-Alexandrium_andersonii.AAC.1
MLGANPGQTRAIREQALGSSDFRLAEAAGSVLRPTPFCLPAAARLSPSRRSQLGLLSFLLPMGTLW